MNLHSFIKILKDLEDKGHGNLPVCLDDWQEGYYQPSEKQAEIVKVVSGHYSKARTKGNAGDGSESYSGNPDNKEPEVNFIQIGESG